MKSEMKRKGFTLVELLIVIVVIGILSAMMMLSSTEAVTSAKVSNIVSNLRNLKTAALSLYTDSMDFFAEKDRDDNFKLDDYQGRIRAYLGSGNNTPEIGDYQVVVSSKNGSTWWVLYQIKGTASEVSSIKNKLAGRAKSLGLKGGSSTTLANDPPVYTTEAYVALPVR